MRVNIIVRLLCVLLMLSGCVSTKPSVKPSDTKFKETKRNWEYLYAKELDAALENEDAVAYYFFWPYYLQERHRNKCKQYNEFHGKTCACTE